jgi:hypothetical protein
LLADDPPLCRVELMTADDQPRSFAFPGDWSQTQRDDWRASVLALVEGVEPEHQADALRAVVDAMVIVGGLDPDVDR